MCLRHKYKIKTINLLEDFIGGNLDDLGDGRDLVTKPKAQATTGRRDRPGLVRIKTSAKDHINQPTDRPHTGRKYL